MEIRAYRQEDIKEIAELFYNTVHTVNAADYTEKQLDAWADGNIDLAAWERSFQGAYDTGCGDAVRQGKWNGTDRGLCGHGQYRISRPTVCAQRFSAVWDRVRALQQTGTGGGSRRVYNPCIYYGKDFF